VGEAYNGLVLDEMALERVPRWASYVGTGCKRGGWVVALVWDGYMGVVNGSCPVRYLRIVLWIVRYYGVKCVPVVCRVLVQRLYR
jgi:hypothetical protein